MYVNHERYVQYTYTCLIGTLCQEKNKGMTYIISICHDLILWDLMPFVCHMRQDTSLLWLVWMYTLYDIYVRHNIMRASFPSMDPATWVCASRRSGSWVHIRARLVGSCVCVWAVCRDVRHIQPKTKKQSWKP